MEAATIEERINLLSASLIKFTFNIPVTNRIS